MVDCSVEEELCSSCQLSVAVDQEGRVLSTSMEGGGAIPYTKVSSILMVCEAVILLCVLVTCLFVR